MRPASCSSMPMRGGSPFCVFGDASGFDAEGHAHQGAQPRRHRRHRLGLELAGTTGRSAGSTARATSWTPSRWRNTRTTSRPRDGLLRDAERAGRGRATTGRSAASAAMTSKPVAQDHTTAGSRSDTSRTDKPPAIARRAPRFASSGSNTSSTRQSNSAAILNASGRLGSWRPALLQHIDRLRETSNRSASSPCDQPRSARRSAMLFFTGTAATQADAQRREDRRREQDVGGIEPRQVNAGRAQVHVDRRQRNVHDQREREPSRMTPCGVFIKVAPQQPPELNGRDRQRQPRRRRHGHASPRRQPSAASMRTARLPIRQIAARRRTTRTTSPRCAAGRASIPCS